ncbi:MAG: hypothetical protein JWR52_1503 [Marmoricola sp.]|nr:hypothetical protein [Marmoricola sp.]
MPTAPIDPVVEVSPTPAPDVEPEPRPLFADTDTDTDTRTIALDTSVREDLDTDSMEIAIVPVSRRAKAEARKEASQRAKAEKEAAKAAARAEKEHQAPAEKLVAKLPRINPAVAALITGLLSGLACVLLAKGASAGCDAVRGNGSCGGGFGLLALVGILAVEVLIGANLLKAFRLTDPFSTSFLGVGLVAMFAMLFFLNVISKPWMIGAIPAMTALSFLLSWWVTVRFVEEVDEE